MLRVFSKQTDKGRSSSSGNLHYATLYDDILSNELYSDNEEMEHDLVQMTELVATADSSSVKSNHSRRSLLRRRRERKKKQAKKPPIQHNTDDLDDIIQSFAKNRSPSRTKVIVPAAEEEDSSYHSGFSSSMSFHSAAQSIHNRSVHSKRSSASSKHSQRSGLRNFLSRKSQNPEGDVAVAVAAAALGKKERSRKFPKLRRNKSEAEAGEQSVRSSASSMFGWSVTSLSVKNFIKRRKKKQAAKEYTERTEESIPTEVGIVSNPSMKSDVSIDSDQAVRKSHHKAFAKKLLRRPKKTDKLALAADSGSSIDVILSSSSTGRIHSKKKQSTRKKLTKAAMITPKPHYRMDSSDLISASSTIESSLADALKASASACMRQELPDFAPRLEGADVPLLGSSIPNRKYRHKAEEKRQEETPRIVIDPLDIELFLNRGENPDGEVDFDDDDVSTLSSGTSLTLSSSPSSVMDFRKKDDYGVYKRSSSLTATNTDTRMTSLLHGELSDMVKPETPAYLPPSMAVVDTHKTISLLLIHMGLKIFEIVEVIVTRGTTVGDAIDKAKTAAVDSTLAKQNYVSLCSDVKEFFLPAPVSKIAPWQDTSPKIFASDEEMKREMERVLLVAVPETSNSSDCRKIRRMLWKNPKLQVWWKATKQPTQRGPRNEFRASRSLQ